MHDLPFKRFTNEPLRPVFQNFKMLSVFIWCPQLIVCVSLSAVGRVYLYRKSSVEEAPKCSRCSLMIYDATLVSCRDKVWHKSCFRCLLCQKELNDVCFIIGNESYCPDDFNRLYRSQCAGCSGDLNSLELLRRIFGRLYHGLCFKCILCDCSLQTGERVYLLYDNKLICEKDYMKLLWQEGQGSPFQSDNTQVFDMFLLRSQQEDVLNRAYDSNPVPSFAQCKEFSEEIGLKTTTEQAWFREKRCRDRNVMANDPDKNFFSWLGNAFSPNCIPPNIELTPDVIRDGEVLLTRLHKSDAHRTARNVMANDPDKNCFSWLGNAFSPNCIPPNIELTPDVIRDGEVLLTHLHKK